MGWTTFHSNEKPLDWFKYHIEGATQERYTVLASSLRNNVIYAAVRNNQTNEVFATIYLISNDKNDYCNFGYKDMDETVHPCYYDCPQKIMKLLTPTDSQYANDWRNEVNKRLNQKKELKGIKDVKTNEPITFSKGYTFQYFRLVDGKPKYAMNENKQLIARVKFNINDYQFNII